GIHGFSILKLWALAPIIPLLLSLKSSCRRAGAALARLPTNSPGECMPRDDDQDDRPRRRQPRYDDEDDYPRRPRAAPRSGAVTGVGVISIVMGIVDLLLGLCLLVLMFFALADGGGRGGPFGMPGLGGAVAGLFMLLVFVWGVTAVIAGAGV